MPSDSELYGPQKLLIFQYGLHPFTNVPVPGYLVEMANGSRVLIDTGFPRCSKGSMRGPHWFRIMPEDHVSRRLEAIGLHAGSVQYVVSSHFDPDHCGAHDMFPHATFFVQRKHYEVALSGKYDRFEIQRPHWDHPDLRYQLVEGDEEVLPGICLIETSGHVPGHQSVMVRLQSSRKLLLAIDAISTAAGAYPDTYVVHPFDMDPEGARRSIGKLQSIVHMEKVECVIFGHDPAQWPQLRRAPFFYA